MITEATLFVTYRGDAARRFDRDYYIQAHMPLVRDACSPYGLSAPAAFFPAGDGGDTIAVAVCRFRDEAAMAAAFESPATAGVLADVRNFTNVQPSRCRGWRYDAQPALWTF